MKHEHRSMPFYYDDSYLNERRISTWNNIEKFHYTFTPFFLLDNACNLNSNTNINAYLTYYNFTIYNVLKLHKQQKTLSLLRNLTANDSLVIFNEYKSLRQSSFTKFFMDYAVDTPLCFKNSNSIKRLNFEFPFLKFNNFLMWEGKREKTFIVFLRAFHILFKIDKLQLDKIVYNNWTLLYHFTNMTFCEPNKNMVTINCKININTCYEHFFYNKKKYFSEKHYFYNSLWKIIKTVVPLFAFSVYNVDKNIRKFSRSRANKYVFIWKYIPLYKRALKTLRLIAKDVKFNEGTVLEQRIANSLHTLKTNPTESFIWRINKFSHNYVFKNFKKTLLTTLRTTS